MTSYSDTLVEFLKLAGSLSVLTGAFAWWRKDSEEEDRVISDAAGELLEALSNADTVSKIRGETDINVREQVTIQEAEDWARDRDLRGQRNRN